MRRSILLITLLLAVSNSLIAQHASVLVQIVDRGQADGILIRTPNDRWVVIDGGGRDHRMVNAMENVWGVDEVALLIVSHRHGDHHGGVPPILQSDIPVRRYVGNLVDCPNRTTDDTVRDLLESLGVPRQSLGADTIPIDGVDFIILPPDPVDDPCPQDENDNSIVVRMEFGDWSMLFTGDAETDERQWLMANHPELLDVDILKASHHGSHNGADGEVGGESWMDFVTPEDVVISVADRSQHGHPHTEAMDAYEDAVGHFDIHCTSRHGTMRIYGYRSGWHRIYRQNPVNESCRF